MLLSVIALQEDSIPRQVSQISMTITMRSLIQINVSRQKIIKHLKNQGLNRKVLRKDTDPHS